MPGHWDEFAVLPFVFRDAKSIFANVISIVDLNLGNRSVANDVENVLRTDRVVSPGLLNVILLVELGRPPDLSPARSPAAKSCCGAVAPRPHASILPKRRILVVIGSRQLEAGGW